MVHAWDPAARAPAVGVVPAPGLSPPAPRATEPHVPPSDSPVLSFLRRVHDRHRLDASGAVATYIPQLARADPTSFGIVVATVDGAVYEIGDTRIPFTIQSMAKPLTYAAILDHLGPAAVRGADRRRADRRRVQRDHARARDRDAPQPDGQRGRDHRGGADARVGRRRQRDRRVEALVASLGRFAGRDLDLDESVYRLGARHGPPQPGDRAPAPRHGRHRRRPRRRVDAYFRRCCGRVRDRARPRLVAATLANGGRHPLTGERARPTATVRDTVSRHGHLRHVRRRGRVDVRRSACRPRAACRAGSSRCSRVSSGSASGRRPSTAAGTASAASPSAATSPASSTCTSSGAPARRRLSGRAGAVAACPRSVPAPPTSASGSRATGERRGHRARRGASTFVAARRVARRGAPVRRRAPTPSSSTCAASSRSIPPLSGLLADLVAALGGRGARSSGAGPARRRGALGRRRGARANGGSRRPAGSGSGPRARVGRGRRAQPLRPARPRTRVRPGSTSGAEDHPASPGCDHAGRGRPQGRPGPPPVPRGRRPRPSRRPCRRAVR